MAKIGRRDGTGERALRARVVVGRAERCDLKLDDGRVSGEHAAIFFEAGRWFVRDLASRNGTRLNGIVVDAPCRRSMSVGDVLSFGSDEESWCLQDDAPPSNDASIIQTDRAAVELAELRLEFVVSSDEEDVILSIVSPSQTLDTPPRAFTYLLLTLARARLADREQAGAETEHGWVHVDDLVPGLYGDVETLNVNIYRARKYFAELGIAEAERVVERRSGSRRIRLGVSEILVTHSLTQARA